MMILRPIPGYEGYGFIRNDGTVITRSNHIRKPTVNEHDDLFIAITINGKRYRPRIKDLVAKAFVPNPDNLRYVWFIDGDKTNLHYTNLRWSVKMHGKEETTDA